MARSSTTIRPGERLALKHGMYSQSKIAEWLPSARARVAELLAANPIPAQRVDDLVRERYTDLWAEYYNVTDWLNNHEGSLSETGKVRDAARHRLQISDRLEKLERIMGIGALPRAQTAQLQANANLSQTEVLAAEQRLAAKRALRLIEGSC